MGESYSPTSQRTLVELMKFLIDECLHTSLIGLAHEAGHVCDHVNFLGLGGQKDWQLMAKMVEQVRRIVTRLYVKFWK